MAFGGAGIARVSVGVVGPSAGPSARRLVATPTSAIQIGVNYSGVHIFVRR